MGGDRGEGEHAPIEAPRRPRLCEPVVVVEENAGQVSVPLRMPSGAERLVWRLTTEQGETLEGSVAPTHRLRLPVVLPMGYHRLHLSAGRERAESRLITVPTRSWSPGWMERKERLWGLTAPLYALTSRQRSPGGDFGVLARLVDAAAGLGADVVALSPVHALFSAWPRHHSPYAPSSRRWIDEGLIDVIEGARLLGAVEEIRSIPSRDRQLRRLFAMFFHAPGQRATHRALRQAFEGFMTTGGEDLFAYALFQGLHRHFEGRPWPRWPDGYRSPAGVAARRWGADHPQEIGYGSFLQWLAAHQLRQVGTLAAERMKVGLGADLAVGVPAESFDVWAEQALFARQMRVGAPPDAFNAAGQNWGLVPWSPQALREAGYEPWIAVVRAAMRLGGAVRIDHAMALERLFCIPEGAPPEQGAYVHYRSEEMLGILALESHRHHCLVMAEDLGTVPEGFRRRLRDRGMLSTRLVPFERERGGEYRPAATYPYESVAAISTHDLPPLRGWLTGHDLAVRGELGLLGEAGDASSLRRQRVVDRNRLIDRLTQEGVLPEGFRWPGQAPEDHLEPLLREVMIALCGFLGRAGSALRLLSLEDLAFSTEQLNLPGTTEAYPNWQVPIPLAVEALAADPFVSACAAAVAPRQQGETPGKG